MSCKSAIRHSGTSDEPTVPSERPVPVSNGPQCQADVSQECWAVSFHAGQQEGILGLGAELGRRRVEYREDQHGNPIPSPSMWRLTRVSSIVHLLNSTVLLGTEEAFDLAAQYLLHHVAPPVVKEQT